MHSHLTMYDNADDAFAFDSVFAFNNSDNMFVFDNVFAFNNADDAFTFDNALMPYFDHVCMHLRMPYNKFDNVFEFAHTFVIKLTMYLSLRILSALEFHIPEAIILQWILDTGNL